MWYLSSCWKAFFKFYATAWAFCILAIAVCLRFNFRCTVRWIVINKCTKQFTGYKNGRNKVFANIWWRCGVEFHLFYHLIIIISHSLQIWYRYDCFVTRGFWTKLSLIVWNDAILHLLDAVSCRALERLQTNGRDQDGSSSSTACRHRFHCCQWRPQVARRLHDMGAVPAEQ